MTRPVRELVAIASQVLAAQGQDDLIWGHASVRDEDGRGVWIKAAEWSLAEVDADRVHLVGWDGSVLSGEGARHSEYPIHTEIMAARPDVGAVVHTHPPHAVALAASGQPLLPVSHAATMFVPPAVPRFTDTADLILTPAITITPRPRSELYPTHINGQPTRTYFPWLAPAYTADLILTPDLGRQVAAELGEATAVFLVNHGVVVVGPDLATATVRAVVLERACRQQLLTAAYGGWPSWSGPAEALAKRGHIYSERAVAAVWDHLVRQLAAPDLDLQEQS